MLHPAYITVFQGVSLNMSPRTAQTSAPILESLSNRWSPRAFDANHEFPEGALRGIFEAARWAPSANNVQPWHFIVARRGTEGFAQIAESLVGFNQAWAGSASALLVAVAETADEEGNARPWAHYDLGQAMAHLSVQAQSEGIYVHQMGGFDPAALKAAFNLGENQVAVTVSTLGTIAESADHLPEMLQERETAPRERRPLEDIVTIAA